jgi:hypothetical protein
MTREAARRECREARERVRKRELARPLADIIDEVALRASGRRPIVAEPVDAGLAEKIAWARSLRPLPLPEPKPAAPKTITYIQRGSRWSSFRTVVVPEPVKAPRVDSWGRPRW